MKLLHINSYYGGGMLYKNLYDKQIENNLHIDVYVPTLTTSDFSSLQMGDYTTVRKNHYKYDRYFFYIKHKKIYKDLLKNYKIDNFSIVHAHSLFSNGYIALKAKKNFGIPYIVAVRNTDVNQFFKKMVFLRKLGVEVLKEAESIIFLSESYKKYVVEKYVPDKFKRTILDKSVVIPNGIDKFWFQNKGTPANRFIKEVLKLVYVGEISRNKNVLTTVRAIELLRQRGYDVKLTVVGRVTEQSIYEEIVNLFFVNYIEPQPKEKLLEIYRSNHIFVMPSITETFGLVYAEAMSQGLPVIYSKGQGFDCQFEEGVVGYHVDSLNPNEIAERVIDIVNNYEVISNNCLNNVEKFNWDRLSKQYSSIYSKSMTRLPQR